MTNKRIEYIDTLRGFAIFLVTLGHVLENSGYNKGPLFQFIYSFHMPLFFCISGFVLAYSFDNKVATTNNVTVKECYKFVFDKFKAIMLPYYTWSLIARPLFFYTFNGTLNYQNIIDAVFINNTSFWFLPCLFGLSIIFITYKFLLYSFSERYRNNILVKMTIAVLLTLCLFVLYYITKYDFLRSVSNYIVPFVIGVVMAEYKRIYNFVCHNSYVYSSSLVAFCLMVGMFILPTTHITELVCRFVCGILSIPVCFNIFCNSNLFSQRINNWFNVIGKSTLIIYVVQFSFIVKLPIIPGLNVFLQICIFSAMSVLMIYIILLISKVFEQSKILRVFFLGRK